MREIVFKVISDYDSDYNMYCFFNDIWNLDNKHNLTYSDDYTHLILHLSNCNACPSLLSNVRVSKENIYVFATEPYWSPGHYIDLPKHCKTVFYYDPNRFNNTDNVIKYPAVALHRLFDQHFKSSLIFKQDNTKNILSQTFEKTKKLSIIINNHGSGYSDALYDKRQNLAIQLLNSDIDFDMYGFDWGVINDTRFKGWLPNKLDGIKDYKYNLALENTSISAWITEKFIDPIMCNTIPIYNGHKDVELYYPNSYEYLEYDDNSINRIREILNSNKTYKDYSIKEAREKYLLGEYNPFNIVKKTIEDNEKN
jgi:hypothetical protein